MNTGKHIGITSAVKRTLREAVDEHGRKVIAQRIGVAENTIRNYLDGTSTKWRTGTRDKIRDLSIEKVEVITQAASPIRRLYSDLKEKGVSDDVLGIVARFILENE